MHNAVLSKPQVPALRCSGGGRKRRVRSAADAGYSGPMATQQSPPGAKSAGSPGTADFEQLAKRYLDLWQSEMARMAQMLYEGAVVDAQACEQMVAILASVDAAMRKAVPAQYKVAAKPGWVTDARCETGIVFLDDRPFVLSVMSTYNGPGNGNPVGPITEIVFDHFERLAHSNLYGHRTGERPK